LQVHAPQVIIELEVRPRETVLMPVHHQPARLFRMFMEFTMREQEPIPLQEILSPI